MTQTKRIESYGLYDFCKDIEEALKAGYQFDFESIENFPTAYGTMFTCGLVQATEKVADEVAEVVADEVEVVAEAEAKTETEEVVQDEVEAAETPESAPAKRGPKPKAK